MQTLDVLVGGCVEELPRASPPDSPVVGASYIVDANAAGEWSGESHSVAAFTSGGWRYIAAQEGMTAYIRSTGTWAAYREGGWEIGLLRGSGLLIDGQQVVGNRAAPIVFPAGGATIDAEARVAINQILTSLRQHGLIEV